MQVLRAFFTELEDTEEISRSPFRKISRDRRAILTRKKYDDPIFLRKEEFEALRNFKLADRFKLMNLAFDQEDYRVDKNLEMIDSSVKKDS